jgi:hypothetical protein
MPSSSFIYTSDPGLIVGFHGCDESVRDKIVMGGPFRPSKNEWDWLAGGIYFWQNNYERALRWAQNAPPKVKIKKPSVLGAVFSLGNCLDLTDKKWLDHVRYSFETLKQSFEAIGTPLPQNSNTKDSLHSNDRIIRRLDCAVINNIHDGLEKGKLPPFDSVRAVFFEGNPLYDGAGFLDKTHIQICIRNPNCIKGYFIPRKETDWPQIINK